MVERRVTALIAAGMVFLVSAVLWDAFFRPTHAPGGSGPAASGSSTAPAVGGDTPATSAGPAAPPPPLPRPALTQPTGPTYMELFARSEWRLRLSRAMATFEQLVAERVPAAAVSASRSTRPSLFGIATPQIAASVGAMSAGEAVCG